MLEALDPIEDESVNEDERSRVYLSVFTSEFGKVVLADMLWDLYWMRPCETPEQQALCNYAKLLLITIYGKKEETRPTRLLKLMRKLLRKGK